MQNPSKKAISATCPGCGARVQFQRMPQLGQFIVCDECDDMLEVVNLNPLTIDWSSDDDLDYDDEDWDDDDDDDEDDDYDGYDD